MGRQTDERTDGWTDKQTDKRTDEKDVGLDGSIEETAIIPSQSAKKIIRKKKIIVRLTLNASHTSA